MGGSKLIELLYKDFFFGKTDSPSRHGSICLCVGVAEAHCHQRRRGWIRHRSSEADLSPP